MAAVAIKGLNEIVRDLSKLGVDAQDLRDAFTRVADLAYTAAQSRVPKRSGAMAGGIKKSRRKNAAILRQRTPYYWAFAHFGAVTWPQPVPYLYLARDDVEGQVAPLVERELDSLISKLGF